MNHLSLLLFAGCVLPGAVAVAASRERQLLDAGWRFHLGDVPAASQAAFDDAAWRQLDLPHDWSIEGAADHAAPGAGAVGFFPSGIGWYRRHFVDPPSVWKGSRRVTVDFEGVYMNAEVWVNGHRLGLHPYGYTPVCHDITPFLKTGQDNVLAVRVDNSQQPNSRWYSGSGIYRHVWLEVAGPWHLAPAGVFLATTALSEEAATIRVDAVVRNDAAASVPVAAVAGPPAETAVTTRVFAPDGHAVAIGSAPFEAAPGSEAQVTYHVTIPRPQAWSPESPVLYRAVTSVTRGNRFVDEVTTWFGVRTVRVSAERGFELNGRPLKLLGGSIHHDNGPLGAAAFDRAEERRVALLKAAGFNAVRTAHNPPSPAFLDACDRLGLLVMDEAFDGWAKAKNPHDYSVVFNEWWPRDLDAMVRRDRNHPSVVMWSIGNEVFERGAPSGAKLAREMAARIRELDATRPVTAGINDLGEGGDWTKLDPLFAALDLAGYNYVLQHHAADHARLPARAIAATESYQSEAFANWAAVRDHPYVVGDFVWSALDYLGEAGIGRVFPPGQPAVRHWEGDQFPWHGAYCGDLDLTGWRKPVSHYRNLVWERGETLYAAVLAPTPDGRPWNLTPWSMPPALPSWTWPGQEGKDLTVEVYSRHDAVRLYLNDRLLGEKPTTRAEEFKATFAVPYVAGMLKAVGLRDGHEVETFALATAGDAARLRLTADRATIHANGQDLAFVTVEITDTDGRLRPDADPAVRFAVSGPATIAGIGTGDLASPESYQANPHRAFQGRALVILRTTSAAGAIALTAQAPGLGETVVILRSILPP
jgi:beta-galactosidase